MNPYFFSQRRRLRADKPEPHRIRSGLPLRSVGTNRDSRRGTSDGSSAGPGSSSGAAVGDDGVRDLRSIPPSSEHTAVVTPRAAAFVVYSPQGPRPLQGLDIAEPSLGRIPNSGRSSPAEGSVSGVRSVYDQATRSQLLFIPPGAVVSFLQSKDGAPSMPTAHTRRPRSAGPPTVIRDSLPLSAPQRVIAVQLFIEPPVGMSAASSGGISLSGLHMDLVIQDRRGRHRLLFSSNLEALYTSTLHTKVPLRCIREAQWTNVYLDVLSLHRSLISGGGPNSAGGGGGGGYRLRQLSISGGTGIYVRRIIALHTLPLVGPTSQRLSDAGGGDFDHAYSGEIDGDRCEWVPDPFRLPPDAAQSLHIFIRTGKERVLYVTPGGSRHGRGRGRNSVESRELQRRRSVADDEEEDVVVERDDAVPTRATSSGTAPGTSAGAPPRRSFNTEDYLHASSRRTSTAGGGVGRESTNGPPPPLVSQTMVVNASHEGGPSEFDDVRNAMTTTSAFDVSSTSSIYSHLTMDDVDDDGDNSAVEEEEPAWVQVVQRISGDRSKAIAAFRSSSTGSRPPTHESVACMTAKEPEPRGATKTGLKEQAPPSDRGLDRTTHLAEPARRPKSGQRQPHTPDAVVSTPPRPGSRTSLLRLTPMHSAAKLQSDLRPVIPLSLGGTPLGRTRPVGESPSSAAPTPAVAAAALPSSNRADDVRPSSAAQPSSQQPELPRPIQDDNGIDEEDDPLDCTISTLHSEDEMDWIDGRGRVPATHASSSAHDDDQSQNIGENAGYMQSSPIYADPALRGDDAQVDAMVSLMAQRVRKIQEVLRRGDGVANRPPDDELDELRHTLLQKPSSKDGRDKYVQTEVVPAPLLTAGTPPLAATRPILPTQLTWPSHPFPPHPTPSSSAAHTSWPMQAAAPPATTAPADIPLPPAELLPRAVEAIPPRGRLGASPSVHSVAPQVSARSPPHLHHGPPRARSPPPAAAEVLESWRRSEDDWRTMDSTPASSRREQVQLLTPHSSSAHNHHVVRDEQEMTTNERLCLDSTEHFEAALQGLGRPHAAEAVVGRSSPRQAAPRFREQHFLATPASEAAGPRHGGIFAALREAHTALGSPTPTTCQVSARIISAAVGDAVGIASPADAMAQSTQTSWTFESASLVGESTSTRRSVFQPRVPDLRAQDGHTTPRSSSHPLGPSSARAESDHVNVYTTPLAASPNPFSGRGGGGAADAHEAMVATKPSMIYRNNGILSISPRYPEAPLPPPIMSGRRSNDEDRQQHRQLSDARKKQDISSQSPGYSAREAPAAAAQHDAPHAAHFSVIPASQMPHFSAMSADRYSTTSDGGLQSLSARSGGRGVTKEQEQQRPPPPSNSGGARSMVYDPVLECYLDVEGNIFVDHSA